MTDSGNQTRSARADRDDARPEQLWLAGLFLSTVLLLLFGWLAEEVSEGDTQSFDRRVILLFRHAGRPRATPGPTMASIDAA